MDNEQFDSDEARFIDQDSGSCEVIAGTVIIIGVVLFVAAIVMAIIKLSRAGL